MFDPDKQRWFAVEVVKQLRAHEHESYWAGGCVRDELLGHKPKDYDVATSARPDEIRHIFGKRKTLAIGAAFGVITVLGPSGAGQIEVATFRQDVSYSDGRRPDEVRFSSPREDALRRDFTINGMFYDPVEGQLIDFVGGKDDLERRLIRAIGEPRERFTEDKLRMLRAVRFAAAFEFALEEHTEAAIREMAHQLTVVSAERIAAEMRAMLEGAGRANAVELLRQTALLERVLPEVTELDDAEQERWQTRLRFLDALDRPTFPQALAVLLGWPQGEKKAAMVGPRWRLSNKEIERTDWLLRHGTALDDAAGQPWPRLQPVLVYEGIDDLMSLYQTAARMGLAAQADVDFGRQKLALPPEQLNPLPLVTGEDLIALGVPKGKLYAVLLKAAREAQLAGVIHTPEEAKAFVLDRWRQSRG
ncbi:MAG: CCA tRNA nucleotidyltransferase [Pirellulales bacterium]